MSLEHYIPYTPDDQTRAVDTIHYGPEGGRDFTEYCKIFNLKREDLEGKRILDLGAGSELRFAEGVKERGINAEVISYSPGFLDEYTRARALLTASTDVKKRLVVGMGEQLPFQDGAFDMILSIHVADYVHARMNERLFLEEIARTLAPGGMAYIYPISALKGLLETEGTTLFDGKARFVEPPPQDKGGGIRIKKM